MAGKCFIWQLQMDGRHFYDPKTQGFWVVEMGFWVVEFLRPKIKNNAGLGFCGFLPKNPKTQKPKNPRPAILDGRPLHAYSMHAYIHTTRSYDIVVQ